MVPYPNPILLLRSQLGFSRNQRYYLLYSHLIKVNSLFVIISFLKCHRIWPENIWIWDLLQLTCLVILFSSEEITLNNTCEFKVNCIIFWCSFGYHFFSTRFFNGYNIASHFFPSKVKESLPLEN
jgi:hypothetical protein